MPNRTKKRDELTLQYKTLPEGDPRVWAQTLQDLVLAALRDNRCQHISDVDGRSLQTEAVWAFRKQLQEQGILPGEVVLIKAVNDLTGVCALLGAWLHGCTVCPVDPSATPEVHDLITHHSGAKIIVQEDGTLQVVPQAIPCKRIKVSKPTGVELGLIIFTSGSSGNPKGVLLTHSNVMSSLRAIATFLDIQAEDKIVCVPPMFLDYGLYQVLFVLFTGCQLVLASSLTNPLKILSLIKQTQPSILPVVPALASGLAKVLNTFHQTVDSLRTVSNTGGHLAPATIEAMRRSFPNARIFPMYGLTETKRALYLPPEMVDQKPGSVGGPMPGMDARVVIANEDGSLEEAEVGQVGELYLRGSSVMQGYHGQDNSAGARLIHGNYRDDVWLATGDLFEMDADGCLYFRGRSKSLIKQKGFCIYPRDLEAVAEMLPDVASAVVVGREEEDGDESAVLFVVLNGSKDEAHQEDVREQILERLHKSLQPRMIHFLPEWPALSVGKIDVGALKQMARQL